MANLRICKEKKNPALLQNELLWTPHVARTDFSFYKRKNGGQVWFHLESYKLKKINENLTKPEGKIPGNTFKQNFTKSTTDYKGLTRRDLHWEETKLRLWMSSVINID